MRPASQHIERAALHRLLLKMRKRECGKNIMSRREAEQGKQIGRSCNYSRNSGSSGLRPDHATRLGCLCCDAAAPAFSRPRVIFQKGIIYLTPRSLLISPELQEAEKAIQGQVAFLPQRQPVHRLAAQPVLVVPRHPA
jgi:hypothetical protein